MWFLSDNTQPVAPAVLAALAEANAGHARSYGAEEAMLQVTETLRGVFEAPEAEIFLVATGTAANALALAGLCPPWGAVYCHEGAHVNEDECGAPEFYTAGAKLIGLPGEHGRIDPAALETALAKAAELSVHNVQPSALSVTNATEAGTVYAPGALAALSARAKAAGLGIHMDGARFANALVSVGCSPAELSWKAGVDVLCLGGTKDGCLGVEAVLFFDPERAETFAWRRKRGGHLFSKHRYLSAQMQAWLAGDLWLDLAARANARAAGLAHRLSAFDAVEIVHPVEANCVFAAFPRSIHRALKAAGAEYHLWDFHATLEGPDDEPLLARFVCGWSTSEAEIDALVTVLRG